MIVKQIAGGEGFKYYVSAHPQWVKDLWIQGFSPLREPFLYVTSGGNVFSFPPGFQFITTFFYIHFGTDGLYFLPLSCMLLLWVTVFLVLKNANVSAVHIAVALIILIFCSPLTIYGLVYWEHMPAVFLLTVGCFFLVKDKMNPAMALLYGLLSGLAVWLRPEAILLNLLFIAAAIILQYREKAWANICFISGIVICTGAFFIFNKLEYGAFLGMHSYQVLEETGLFRRLKNLVKNELVINWLLLAFFPFVIFLVPVAYGFRKKKLQAGLRLWLLLAVIVCFLLGAPFILPNTGGRQWGPRYFLPVIPAIVIFLSVVWTQNRDRIGWGRRKLWGLFLILCIMYSAWLNVYKGGIQEFREGNLQRVKPLYDYVAAQRETTVIVDSEFIPMELAQQYDRKYFFLAEDPVAFNRLLPLLKQQGITSFVYISGFQPGAPSSLIYQPGSKILSPMGMYYAGKYRLKEAISPGVYE